MHAFKYSALWWVVFGAVAVISGISTYFYLLYSISTNNGLESADQSAVGTPVYTPQAAPTVTQTSFVAKDVSWRVATSSAAWQPRDSTASFVFQNKMWTMGGLNDNQEVGANHLVEYWEAPHFNDIWTSGDGAWWERVKEHAEWPPRRSMSVVLFKDKLWMFGGWSPSGGYTSDIWQSTDGITWKKVIDEAAWPAREGQTVEVFQGKLWIFGGVNYDKREIQNDVWYSDDGLDWHEATTTNPWSPRWDHATTVFKGKLYLVGGMNLSQETFNDVWFSGDGITWEPVVASAPWQTRQGHALIVWHDMLWIIGRLNDNTAGGVNDVWYSADGVTWQKTDIDPPWAGREDHSALLFNDRVYVFGGMDRNWRWRNDVWVSSE